MTLSFRIFTADSRIDGFIEQHLCFPPGHSLQAIISLYICAHTCQLPFLSIELYLCSIIESASHISVVVVFVNIHSNTKLLLVGHSLTVLNYSRKVFLFWQGRIL